jgi:branched-chain amino acid transport system substrate-binding protein
MSSPIQARNLRRSLRLAAGAATVALLAAACTSNAASPNASGGSSGGAGKATIKIGALSTLEGPFAALGDLSMQGVKLALMEAGGTLTGTGTRDGVTGATVNGVPIQLSIEGSDATPDVAVEKARKLVEQDGSQIIIGPLSGDEGLALKDYVKGKDVTLINGTSASQNLTLRDPEPNVFRFGADGAMWTYGIGDYAYKTLNYHNIATVAEDYSYPYDQVGSLMTQFCGDGGHVVKKIWVPLGTKDYSSFVAQIPKNVDAVFVALGGTDAVNFVKQFDDYMGKSIPLIAGPTAVDQSVLKGLGSRVNGVISAGPVVDDQQTPEYQAFAKKLADTFPGATPNIFNVYYYIATKSALMALSQVKGDLSDGGTKFRAALSALTWDTPTGNVKLDSNRQAVVDIYLRQIKDGKQVTISTNKAVTATLGQPADPYIAKPSFSRDYPSCP